VVKAVNQATNRLSGTTLTQVTTPGPVGRPFSQHIPRVPGDPARGTRIWTETASIDLIRELLRKHSEIVSYGRRRFTGTLAQKNASWRHYRNFLRQAMSNFDAALNVPNRSACLLYYYALLNFAKAELLNTHASQLVDTFIGHGLQFSSYEARTIAGDTLIVKEGVFRMLYERRTGRTISVNQRLPIKRLLANIPEIGTQLSDAGLGETAGFPILQTLVTDGSSSWPIILALAAPRILPNTSTGRVFFRTFHWINLRPNWRDIFALNARVGSMPFMFESNRQAPNYGLPINEHGAQTISWEISSILSRTTHESVDAWVTPSLYSRDFIPMPASLARYALMYYASSLVRYRPSMLDPQLFPEQSYLFDAIARECAIPMLTDAFSRLENQDQIFVAPGFFRC
jgi:hypothetical protein